MILCRIADMAARWPFVGGTRTLGSGCLGVACHEHGPA